MVRRVVLTAIGCLAVLIAYSSDASGAVDLQYKFKAGEVVRHKIVMDMDVVIAANVPNAPQIPPMHMKMVGIVKQKTMRVLPDGDAEVVDVLESLTMTVGGETRKIEIGKYPSKMTGFLSKFGPSDRMGAASQTPGMLSSLQFGSGGMCQYILLPGQALNVGDYWTDTMNLPLGLSVQQKTKLTAENSKLGSYKVAVLKHDISGSMDLALDQLAQMIGQTDAPIPVDGSIKALIIGDAASYFSLARGRMIRSEGTMDMQMEANVTDGAQGGQFAIRAHINFSVNLAS